MLVAQAKRTAEVFEGHAILGSETERIWKKLGREMQNIVLIGMPGSGKTTVGKRCGQALGLPFIDTDAWVEQKAGKPVPRIFAEDG